MVDEKKKTIDEDKQNNRFFINLTDYYYKENDLSNFLIALVNSSDIIKSQFLKFFGIEIDNYKWINIQREVSIEGGRPDIVIYLENKKKALIEVKLQDLSNCHIIQYSKSESKFDFRFILHANKGHKLEISDEDIKFKVVDGKIVKNNGEELPDWQIRKWKNLLKFFKEPDFMKSLTIKDSLNLNNFREMAKTILNLVEAYNQFWMKFKETYNLQVDSKRKLGEKETKNDIIYPKIYFSKHPLNYKLTVKSKPFQITLGINANAEKDKEHAKNLIEKIKCPIEKKLKGIPAKFIKENSELLPINGKKYEFDFIRFKRSVSFEEILSENSILEKIIGQIIKIMSLIDEIIKPEIKKLL